MSSIGSPTSSKHEQETNILVVEDGIFNREILSRQLPKIFRRSSLTFVETADQATRALRGEEYLATSPDGKTKWMQGPDHFDVAFLDHHMPCTVDGPFDSRAGVEVAKALRRTQSEGDRPCLLVSHSSEQLGEADLEVREIFDEVLVKPASNARYKEIAEIVQQRNNY